MTTRLCNTLLLVAVIALAMCALQAESAAVLRTMNCYGADRANCIRFAIDHMKDPFGMCKTCKPEFDRQSNLIHGLQLYVNCCTRMISLISSAVF
ncbi:hypothetical protein BOX15_Mlig022348g3 [Macrostomum lignano]|uniref:Uncharacterized protein n=1 Tax=Macrostomum lignano TaxID=282301 RepID=A0A267FVV1_9PLAT|nr:hypothetical protein BOX15_Mlig022348g2 [Macrostomum lignano]PAA49424.1 hypothetical protein BOX15_Mlig022348g1 [Macrostomum lignano]PAA77873.1 hypothetical protein BOX15_Mlig026074g1 [Macrostomum lignano]PAA80146.1 hypothetical protein BOX15_Mlig022348g3 [Macrostomum lignano]